MAAKGRQLDQMARRHRSVGEHLIGQEQAALGIVAVDHLRRVGLGFEAAHERILVNIDKRATLADNDRAVAYAKQAGLKIKALMSCGHPGESEETVTDIRDWLIRSEVDDFDCTVITTYPGTGSAPSSCP